MRKIGIFKGKITRTKRMSICSCEKHLHPKHCPSASHRPSVSFLVCLNVFSVRDLILMLQHCVVESGKKAQLVRCFLCKCKEPAFDLQNPHEKAGHGGMHM